jgi:hypothetical protein
MKTDTIRLTDLKTECIRALEGNWLRRRQR